MRQRCVVGLALVWLVEGGLWSVPLSVVGLPSTVGHAVLGGPGCHELSASFFSAWQGAFCFSVLSTVLCCPFFAETGCLVLIALTLTHVLSPSFSFLSMLASAFLSLLMSVSGVVSLEQVSIGKVA